MTDQEKAKLKDQILDSLLLGEKDCKKLSVELDSDFDLIWTLTEEMDDQDGHVRTRNCSTKDGPGKGVQLTPKGETFAKTSSYLSLLESDQKAYTRQKRENNVNMIFKIISAVAVIWGAIFTYLTFMKNEKIDRLEIENESLIKQVDSLEKEIKNVR